MDRLAAMQAFVGVVEAGSFSQAARRLNVGQPAVSKTVAQLEARLGVRLLLRSPRGLMPTEAGRQYYERARRTIETADAADLAAQEAGAGLTGRLRFSAAVTFARLYVIPRLSVFLARHPRLQVDAVLDDRRVDLIEQGVDVGLRIGGLADTSMTARALARSARVVLATPDYLRRHGTPAAPRDLAAHAVVRYAQPGGGASWTFRRQDAAQVLTLPDTVSVNAAEGVREAVLAHIGLCVAPEWMFRPELDQGRVVKLLTGWTLPAVTLWAVYPSGDRPSAKARAFVDFVGAELRGFGFSP